MSSAKLIALDKEKITFLTQFIVLTSVATLAPLFHQQIITGTIVNATLFIATIILGTRYGLLIGLIPSVIALSVGTLPPVLIPMLPYIIISNALLILIFNAVKNKNYWFGVITASFIKFLFLYGSSLFIANSLLSGGVSKNVMMLMSWPQLITALSGGLLAAIFLKFYSKISPNSAKNA